MNRHVDTGERGDAAGIAGRRFEPDIAGHRRQRGDVEVRMAQRVKDRDGVVDAGIGVDDHAHLESLSRTYTQLRVPFSKDERSYFSFGL